MDRLNRKREALAAEISELIYDMRDAGIADEWLGAPMAAMDQLFRHSMANTVREMTRYASPEEADAANRITVLREAAEEGDENAKWKLERMGEL
jgi:hypothetical protein